MGNDGGSIPTRRELVKEAAKDLNTTQVKEVQKEQQEHGWVTCALSQRPLSLPVVSDWSGKLFNKDAVLESLIAGTGDKLEAELSKEKQGEDVHIGSLRDVVEVKFRAEEGGDNNNNENSRSSTRWVCPITNKTLGPGVKAVYLVPCGHAFAESAIKELSAEACLQCDEPFSPENMIPILPIVPADKLRLNERALRLKEQGLTHSLKKAPGIGKKRKKDKTSNDVPKMKAEESDQKQEGPLPVEHQTAMTVGGIKNTGTASLTARVLAEEQTRNKRRKMGNNENIKGLFSSSTEHQGKESDFMTRGFSIPAGARRYAIASAAGADAPRPRGVGPEFGKFYKATDSFKCISNPSVTLDIAKLNDDFCDCPDGSDEPGTSACSYLSDLSPSTLSDVSINNSAKTLALPGFYCKNKGHQPSYVPFLSVNDGVCDYDLCCDGSDEWAKVGGLSCENRCKEIGKEWKKNEEIRQKALGAAQKKRKELVADAGKRRKEVEDRLQSLRTEIEGAEVKLKAAQATLAEVERQERGKVIKGPGKASKVGVLAGLAKERIEELRTSLTDVRFQRDSAKSRLTELETILSTFKDEYNPNFNDEGVKRAVRSWEEFAAREKPWEGDDAHDRDLDEISKPDSESGAIKWEEWEQPEEDSDVTVLYKIEEYLPVPVRDWVDKKLRDLRLLLIENGILAPSRAESDSESKAVSDARSSLKAAEDGVHDHKNELSGHEDDLKKDYGLDDVFRALRGQCVSKDSGEYTYELCWMEQTKQKPKKRGGDTGMGNFVRFDTITVDDEVPADGKGLGSGERVALRYENGQHCWNGPNRSTLVVLACAEKDEIWKITEEEKCVYRMEVGTPAVCSASSAAKPGAVKDEL